MHVHATEPRRSSATVEITHQQLWRPTVGGEDSQPATDPEPPEPGHVASAERYLR